MGNWNQRRENCSKGVMSKLCTITLLFKELSPGAGQMVDKGLHARMRNWVQIPRHCVKLGVMLYACRPVFLQQDGRHRQKSRLQHIGQLAWCTWQTTTDKDKHPRLSSGIHTLIVVHTFHDHTNKMHITYTHTYAMECHQTCHIYPWGIRSPTPWGWACVWGIRHHPTSEQEEHTRQSQPWH